MRYAFTMKLKAGHEAEYRQRHDEIWPDLGELHSRYGIRNYSIYRRDLDLFAYLEIDDPDQLQRLPAEPLIQRWWKYMEPLMECNPDSSPVQVPIEEVFHLD